MVAKQRAVRSRYKDCSRDSCEEDRKLRTTKACCEQEVWFILCCEFQYCNQAYNFLSETDILGSGQAERVGSKELNEKSSKSV